MALPPLTLRSVKGSPLTASEFDDNHLRHEERIDDIIANPPAPNDISNITVTGTQMTIFLEDSTQFGPFTLPRAPFVPSVPQILDPDTDGNFTPGLEHGNTHQTYEGTNPITVILPDDSEVDFLVGTQIEFYQANGGNIFFDVSTDASIDPCPGFINATAQQGAAIMAKKVAANRWRLIGWRAEDTTT